jgi:peptide/nickel transport system substrate-binding protein
MTGPYKLKEYVEGQYGILEAFNDYYMGRPNIDQIVMKIIPDSDVTFASTLNGEIDFGRYTLDLNSQYSFRTSFRTCSTFSSLRTSPTTI